MKDKDQLEVLFMEQYEALHRYAFTILKNSDDAKDVVQSVFLKLWEKRFSLSINSSIKAYLFKSVHNQSIDYLKKQIADKKRYVHLTMEQADKVVVINGQEEEQSINEKINGVLDQLPPQCRIVFVKSRMEQKKYAEIADELGIAIKTVEAHMGKALKLIRQTLRVLAIVCCLIN